MKSLRTTFSKSVPKTEQEMPPQASHFGGMASLVWRLAFNPWGSRLTDRWPVDLNKEKSIAADQTQMSESEALNDSEVQKQKTRLSPPQPLYIADCHSLARSIYLPSLKCCQLIFDWSTSALATSRFNRHG